MSMIYLMSKTTTMLAAQVLAIDTECSIYLLVIYQLRSQC